MIWGVVSGFPFLRITTFAIVLRFLKLPKKSKSTDKLVSTIPHLILYKQTVKQAKLIIAINGTWQFSQLIKATQHHWTRGPCEALLLGWVPSLPGGNVCFFFNHQNKEQKKSRWLPTKKTRTLHPPQFLLAQFFFLGEGGENWDRVLILEFFAPLRFDSHYSRFRLCLRQSFPPDLRWHVTWWGLLIVT